MSTVTTYPDCPCCRPASGSGSGSGRGALIEACAFRLVPRTLYVTFGGAAAAWGTVRFDYSSTTGGGFFWTIGGGSPGEYLPDITCFDRFQSPPYVRVCGPSTIPSPDDSCLLDLQLASGGTYCFIHSDTASGWILVQSWDPFYAEGGGTVTNPLFGPCPCVDQRVTYVISETPP